MSWTICGSLDRLRESSTFINRVLGWISGDDSGEALRYFNSLADLLCHRKNHLRSLAGLAEMLLKVVRFQNVQAGPQ